MICLHRLIRFGKQNSLSFENDRLEKYTKYTKTPQTMHDTPVMKIQ